MTVWLIRLTILLYDPQTNTYSWEICQTLPEEQVSLEKVKIAATKGASLI
jgi:hypothetical protein